ncbi:MAG: hypothetical protein GY720_00375 [bacterium]|nr:hypothetical protein [bacterium]
MPVTLTLHSRGMTYNQQKLIRRPDASTVRFPLARFSPRPDAKALANVSAVEMSVEGKTNMDLGITNVGAAG